MKKTTITFLISACLSFIALVGVSAATSTPANAAKGGPCFVWDNMFLKGCKWQCDPKTTPSLCGCSCYYKDLPGGQNPPGRL